MSIWVLLDDKVGSNKQSLTVAGGLSNDYIVKNIKYNKFAGLPNFIRGGSLLGVDVKQSDDISKDLPDIVISAGRRLASIALNIKKRNPKTKLITILNPNFCFCKFDAVILPKHDNKKGKNVINFMGAMALVSKEKIAEETTKWQTVFDKYSKPSVSFLIGGDTKDTKFDSKKFGEVLNFKETLLISTSRRTSVECIKAIKSKIKSTDYLYDWNVEQGKDNPYLALLGAGDYIVVTGDSISMVAEACTTGKPVYIYMPRESLGKKHYEFCTQMIKDGYAREFKGQQLEKYDYKPLNELDNIVKQIKEIL